ncbi:MAG: sulfite exporter TauE/SafE family protein [Balneolales bacterium]|nr:sulfite exporter TauE/SafE family protein [Balneolales bacterium]
MSAPPASPLPAQKLALYWGMAAVILLVWVLAMFRLGWWAMFADTWPLTLTMVFGSFIAGATAEGGGAVAFPVFTKAFGVAPHDAKIFSFMIQSFGMTMAGLVIYLRKIPVLWHVIGFGLAGGVVGLILGDAFLDLPNPYPKLFFSLVAGVFGFFLIYNRWIVNNKPAEHIRLRRGVQIGLFAVTGLMGGMVSSVIGVGIDMLTFILLTLMFGVNEKISTPTTVVMMGLLSVFGFLWYGAVKQEINPEVWQYWMSCVPVVIFGAPFGAWVCSKIKRDQLLYLLLLLIAVDLGSTLWVVAMTPERILFLVVSSLVASALFYLLLRMRRYVTDH